MVRLAAAGNSDALAAIFERHHQALYRYCRALLGSAEDAEDALQNAMARVVRALPGETRELALKPWLYRIAHNEAMRIAGRQRPQGSLEEAEEVAARPEAEGREARERLGALLADLRELSERQRGALVLRELEGASFAHIASVFGGSEAAAKQTVYEARVCLADFARGRAMECDEVTHALSDRDRRRLRGRPVRGHLRACRECSAFAEALRLRPQELRALAPPLAAPVAAALLGKLLGGGGGGAAGGLGTSSATGGALASLSLPSFALKGLATVAVATSVAVGAEQLAPGLPDGGGGPAAITQGEAGDSAGDRDGEEDGRRDGTQSRDDRERAGREPGGARDERETSVAEATRGESGDRSGPDAGRPVVADRSSGRAVPASGEPGSSPVGGSRGPWEGSGARPGRGPIGDAPRPSAPSSPGGPRQAPAPRGDAPEATAPSARPSPLPRAPALPSAPDVVAPTVPAEAGAGRGSGR
ncbi:MAG: sigma-70 family RNA polymerase sigma factor [Solirubrobacteraceae bacterium MAG38_C4-C5]|nr:sigma-70 family RNA polymerase sigma factor [Candidatus Siliceabacter maunaloa]